MSNKTQKGYPPNWKHCTIHLNPKTGEMHSDGDHSVRAYIQDEIKNLETLNNDLRTFIKKIWSCKCVRKNYVNAAEGNPMFANSDAAKYGEILVELKEIAEKEEKTKDGVPFFDGDIVWFIFYENTVGLIIKDGVGFLTLNSDENPKPKMGVDAINGYSTKKAAENEVVARKEDK